jgi:hypothetical protein
MEIPFAVSPEPIGRASEEFLDVVEASTELDSLPAVAAILKNGVCDSIMLVLTFQTNRQPALAMEPWEKLGDDIPLQFCVQRNLRELV